MFTNATSMTRREYREFRGDKLLKTLVAVQLATVIKPSPTVLSPEHKLRLFPRHLLKPMTSGNVASTQEPCVDGVVTVVGVAVVVATLVTSTDEIVVVSPGTAVVAPLVIVTEAAVVAFSRALMVEVLVVSAGNKVVVSPGRTLVTAFVAASAEEAVVAPPGIAVLTALVILMEGAVVSTPMVAAANVVTSATVVSTSVLAQVPS